MSRERKEDIDMLLAAADQAEESNPFDPVIVVLRDMADLLKHLK